MNLDPAVLDKLADLLASRVIAALAGHDGDGDGVPGDLVDAEGSDHESGIGPAFTPEVIGGGPAGPGGPPGAAPDAKDGEPVLDDLDGDDDEGTDEGEDMADEKYESDCVTEPAPADAKRERMKYRSDADIERAIGSAIDGVRERYESELKAQADEIATLKAEREGERRKGVLEGLQREGYDFDVAKELRRVVKYSAAGFDGHVELIRENYRKDDPAERDDFIPIGAPPAADEDGPGVIAEILRVAEENEITGGDPAEITRLVYSKWNAARRAGAR